MEANKGSQEERRFITIDAKGQSSEDSTLKSLHIPDNKLGSQRKGKCANLFPFLDIFVDSFDPFVLLFPYIFQQIGFIFSTQIMLVCTLLLGLSAKLMIESSRLQPGNLFMQKKEDFESLVNSNRISQNLMVNIAGKIYPI